MLTPNPRGGLRRALRVCRVLHNFVRLPKSLEEIVILEQATVNNYKDSS